MASRSVFGLLASVFSVGSRGRRCERQVEKRQYTVLHDRLGVATDCPWEADEIEVYDHHVGRKCDIRNAHCEFSAGLLEVAML